MSAIRPAQVASDTAFAGADVVREHPIDVSKELAARPDPPRRRNTLRVTGTAAILAPQVLREMTGMATTAAVTGYDS
jgi:hypothetical protein